MFYIDNKYVICYIYHIGNMLHKLCIGNGLYIDNAFGGT